MSARLCSRAGDVDLRLLHIDAVQLPRLYRLGQPDRDGPRAAAEIEHTMAGFEMREQVCGVASRAAPAKKLLKVLVVTHCVFGWLFGHSQVSFRGFTQVATIYILDQATPRNLSIPAAT